MSDTFGHELRPRRGAISGRPTRTRPRRGAITERRVPFDPRLEAFCERVWEEYKREESITYNHVYNLYGEVSRRNLLTGSDNSDLLAFLDELLRIEEDHGCRVSVQDYNRRINSAWSLEYLVGIARECVLNYEARSYALPKALYDHTNALNKRYYGSTDDLAEVAAADIFLARFLAHDFFHYFKVPTGGESLPACTQRVYLNVEADHATDVMEMVVRDIVVGLSTEVREAKVAGPLGLADRSDTIVIYTKDLAASDAVVEVVKAYQRDGNRDFFRDDVPAMLRVDSETRGTAYGAEPKIDETNKATLKASNPKIVIGRESFGSVRSKLIAAAFNESSGDKEVFLDLVARYFGEAGMMALIPYL